MLYIQHRVNTIAQLKEVDSSLGIEIDLRAEGSNIILHHDAFTRGDSFEEFLQYYCHAFIILNVKCEGMEDCILRLLQRYNITNYFFLDMSLPFLVKYVNLGVSKVAVRYSEYEPASFCLNFKGKAEWVWVDGFQDFCLTPDDYLKLRKHFKLCLVSPELQGKGSDAIGAYYKKSAGMVFDAVCTKNPEKWKKL